MPEFSYRAIDKHGHTVRGAMAADTEPALEELLQSTGYWLIECEPADPRKIHRKTRVSRKELIDFCSAMAAMLAAGISIPEAMRTIADNNANPGFAQILEDISMMLEAGNTVFDGMGHHPKVFSEQMRNLVKAGEMSGNLPESFKDLQHYLEWVEKLVSNVKQISIYPIVVLIAVLMFVLLLFTFVVPRFADILISLNIALPSVTQAVMSIGEFTRGFWWLIIGLPIAVVIGVKIMLKRSEEFAGKFDEQMLRLPLFGKISRMIALSRFSHNMAVLVRSGIPILQALGLTHNTVGNRSIAVAVRSAEYAVNEGKPMSVAFQEHNVFSPMMLKMIKVGEESGQLEQALEHVSSRFDEEIPVMVKRIFSILEPAVMLTLIGVVGTVALAIFLPLMSIMGGIG